MSSDRIVLVGIAWTVLLLLLLVVRELLRASERPMAAREPHPAGAVPGCPLEGTLVSPGAERVRFAPDA